MRTLQRHWPETALTWIIGAPEHRLLDGLDGVEFAVYDKRTGAAGMRDLWRRLADRRFDALLHMQLALRANVLAVGLRARRRIGYDTGRSKEGHGLFIRERIPADGRRHVLDVLGSFTEPLGLKQDRVEWRLPISPEAAQWAAEQLPGDARTLLISPCSSHALRNWAAERYAAVADHATARGWRVAICGGRSALERCTADAILESARSQPIDLVGKDTLKQLMAMLARADALLAPDSGPVHIANAVDTPVLGLYACTDPSRSGPYSDRRWTVDRYDEAARRFMDRPASELRWGQRIEMPGVMNLITVDEVIARFDALHDHLAGHGNDERCRRPSPSA